MKIKEINKSKWVLFLIGALVLTIIASASVENNKNVSKDKQEESKTYLYVHNSNGLNLRNSPSTSGEIIKTLENKEKVEYLNEQGNWYEIKSGSDQGWAFSDYIITASELAAINKVNNSEKNNTTNKSNSNNPDLRSLGTWYGESEVFLGKEGDRYAATFSPPVSTNMYQYFVGLIEEIWGLLPSELSNPQEASPAVYYESYVGGYYEYYFIPYIDETTGNMAGVIFWRE